MKINEIKGIVYKVEKNFPLIIFTKTKSFLIARFCSVSTGAESNRTGE